MAEPTKSGVKTPRLRSPAYPGVNLEAAISRAKEFHAKERRNAANVAVAVQHWGFNPSSGGAYIIVAALKSFGLLDEEGSGKERKVKLSGRGLRIVLDERDDSPERGVAIKEAALAPTIHAKLWRKYGTHLPSDANLRHELIFDWKFNENAVDSFIKEYRDTIRFAKLTESDTISSGHEDKEPLDDQDEEEPELMETQQHQPPPKQLPPPPNAKLNPPPATGTRQDVFSLLEGPVTIQWPASLSAESYEDLSDWLDILKRKIGRSVSEI